MSKRSMFAVVAVAILAIVAAGGILASNMGFKLNYPLTPAGPGTGSGKNSLALPYFRQSGLNSALDAILDIGSNSVTPVANIARFSGATDLFVAYTGRMGAGTPFPLAAGESYLVSMNSNVNYIVVGSHDPAFAANLSGPGGGSASGKTFFAPPYNITATNALGLILDIGSNSVAPVANVARFANATDLFVAYTGRMGAGTPFPLVPGAGYLVSMNSTVPYIASHY